MEGGKTANYWPGFVDALTNVVIAMVFVIVVLAIALSFAAQLMGKKMAEQMIKQHIAATAASAAAASPASPNAAAATTARSALPDSVRIAVQGQDAAPKTGARVRGTPKQLQLDFADTALTLDDAAVQRVREVLAPLKAEAAQARVQIVAVGPALQMSENQRSAYVRVMAVRNELLDQGYTADHISVRIDTDSERPAAAVLVSISPQ